jgi:hypothetical protein
LWLSWAKTVIIFDLGSNRMIREARFRDRVGDPCRVPERLGPWGRQGMMIPDASFQVKELPSHCCLQRLCGRVGNAFMARERRDAAKSANFRLAPSRRTSVRTSWPAGGGAMSIPVVD